MSLVKFNNKLIKDLDDQKITYKYIDAEYIQITIDANYIDTLDASHLINRRDLFNDPIKMQIWRADPNAIIPYKVRLSDAGYDLTILKIHKQINSNTIMFDTGICVQVPWGNYIEIVPRSSLSKTGWMLTNSIGIIDNSYTGNIYIVLTKMNPDAADIELPFRGFQMIIRKQYHAIIEDMTDTEITTTSRGAGGFGST